MFLIEFGENQSGVYETAADVSRAASAIFGAEHENRPVGIFNSRNGRWMVMKSDGDGFFAVSDDGRILGREKPLCGLDVWMFMSAGKLI